MAFPAANGAVPLTLQDAWAAARSTAGQIKSQCTNLQAQIAAGNVSAQTILNATSFFANLNTQLSTFAGVAGLAAYAQQQVNNASLDVVAAFTAMQSALVSTVTWIVSNFPKDASNNLLCVQFTAQGLLQWSTFTTAQLSGLSTQLTALSATIN